MKNFLAIIFFLLSFNFISAQASISFCSDQYSPLYLGAGRIGVSNLSDNISGFYLNPAVLGYSGGKNSISFFSSVSLFGLLNPIFFTFSNYSYGGSVMYNFQDSFLKIPVTIGIGYFNYKWAANNILGGDYSKNYIKDLSFGLGFKYYLNFNFGMAIKGVGSYDNYYRYYDYSSQIKATVYDYGFLAYAPLTELLLDTFKYPLNKELYIYPVSDFSIGASLLNYGSNIIYSGIDEKTPPPRSAMIGYTISIGASINNKQGQFNLFNLSFSSEVNDPSIAIENLDGDVEWVFKDPFSDVHLFNNLIRLNYDDNVFVHRGKILSLFETLKIATGSFNDRYGGYNGTKSLTYEVSLSGLLKLIAYLNNNYRTRYISRHLELNFYIVQSPGFPNLVSIAVMFKGA